MAEPYVASATGPRGQLVLRRRPADGALELRVNGVFVMDTRETSSERMLAAAALEALHADREDLRVLIGGLGLGFTLEAVLADPRVGAVVVAEIEPDLVRWHRDGLVPQTAAATVDPRVEVSVGDVRDVLAGQAADSLDLVLLDVDNGPDFLVYPGNASLYGAPFLRLCRDRLRPGGLLGVWSAATSSALNAVVEEVFGEAEEWTIPVILGTRTTTYHLVLGRRDGAVPG